MSGAEASTGDEKSTQSLWSLLPSFDPATDDAREYAQKVRFIHGICPKKELPTLAPRLAMMCKGTAWFQVQKIDPQELVKSDTGVNALLAALSSWEETEEMVTFEKFERALFKIQQKNDESTVSFVNRLDVAFSELGKEVNLAQFQAFVLLRQSTLSVEDKKRVLSMTGGRMDVKAINQAMRSLATKVLLGANEVKKKVYPLNYVDHSLNETHEGESAFAVSNSWEEDDVVDAEYIDSMAAQGDQDAMFVQTFEHDLEDLFQSTPELQSALISYNEARQKLADRRKFRGFWPSGGKNNSKGRGKKGGQKGGGKSSLLERIARTNCKLCGARGHWKAECPRKDGDQKEQANLSVSFAAAMSSDQDVRDDAPFSKSASPAEHVIIDAYVSSEPCSRLEEVNVAHSFISHDNPKYKAMFNVLKDHATTMFMTRRKMMPKTNNGVMSNLPREPSEQRLAESLVSVAEHGFAVLDTGASRSVIGSDLVANLLKDLPVAAQSRVREVDSKIGFRFGNNHVLHSFKQLQIPLLGKDKRVWLLVEVVPGATPFLISIHAMKSLEAQIDLANNKCFVGSLQRSLTIHESHNGLFTIRLRELCEKPNKSSKVPFASGKESTVYASQHFEPSKSIDQPCFQPCSDHAEPSRHDCHHQGNLRTGDGEFEDSTPHAGQFGRDSCHTTTGARSEVSSTERSSFRGATAALSNRRNQCHSEEPEQSSASKSSDCRDRFRRRVGLSFQSTAISQNTSHSGTRSFGYQSFYPKCRGRVTSVSDQSGNGSGASDSEPSTSSPEPSGGSCSHTQPGNLGSEVHQLGQEVDGSSLSGGLREGCGLRAVDFRSCEHVDTGDARFSSLLCDTSTTGNDWCVSESAESHHMIVQDPCELVFSSYLTSIDEESMIMTAMKRARKNQKQIDLLEVYASEHSKLCDSVRALGGTSLRFTKLDGDLSTYEGQLKLLIWIFEHSPKHVWLAPECLPWCSWAKFNQYRSFKGWHDVNQKQNESRPHLRLCNLVMKIQKENGRHSHLENPDPSQLWEQDELQESFQSTWPARFDQCTMGLRHPQNHKLIRKRTMVRTTSKLVHQFLDERFCSKTQDHAVIAGKCKHQGKTMNVSRFAAFYPTGMCKRLAKVLLLKNHEHVDFPVFAADDEEPSLEPPVKKPRISQVSPEKTNTSKMLKVQPTVVKRRFSARKTTQPDLHDVNQDEEVNKWIPVFQQLKRQLPRVGVKEFLPGDDMFRQVRALCPDMLPLQAKACKGAERYITGNPECPYRYTVALSRFGGKIIDLGGEEWTKLSQFQQRRKAIPSHILVCVFGSLREPSSAAVPEQTPAIEGRPSDGVEHEQSVMTPRGNDPLQAEMPAGMPVPETAVMQSLQPWTPAPVSQSGPKFEELSSKDKAIIRKLHHNLGHPVAQTLARHLAFQNARPELIAGAKEYQCSACVERRPPKQGSPGALKPIREFNELVGIDGFEWKNEYITSYVLHSFDEATHFHLGRRTERDGVLTERCLSDFWISWAGAPQGLYFDAAGEFLAERWKVFMQRENIQPKLTAEAWQRGRVERHGGIIKHMLDRMNHENPIRTAIEFDLCLQQCFKAKNSLSNVNGFSPEQAVLGKASKLPASVVSDENVTSHLLADSQSPAGVEFQASLRRRTAAREAFLQSDNSQALRRALLRQSRGEIINWHPGQLCMYWSRRQAANMTEQGRWCGPAQIVLQESRSIVWISHVNKLLRCARESLRPISLREFQDLGISQRPVDSQLLERRAQELRRQLQDRTGAFQFSDLSDQLPPYEDGISNPANTSPNQGQPEEEPGRRNSNLSLEAKIREAVETPIPSTPFETVAEHEESEVPSSPLIVGDVNDIGDNIHEHGIQSSMGDGDSCVPTTPLESDADVVHNALIVEQVCASDVVQEDDGTLWTAQDEHVEDACFFEFLVPVQQIQQFRNNPKVVTALIASAAKKSHAEVSYKNLNQTEKGLFDVAKKKELQCWLDTNTVKSILKTRVHPDRIMSSRWILTWKPCDVSPSGYKPKARLVVKGFQDPEIGSLQTDSPTLSRDGRMLLLQTIASKRWRLQNFDIKTAFLRGRSESRQLAMVPVPELKEMMGLKDGEICSLDGNAYGRVDAPILFYREFRRQLESLGFEAHPLDNCLYLLRNQENPEELDGILGTHVDDGIGGGNQRYEQVLKLLQQTLPFGSQEYDRFRFTGLDLEQLPDYTIKISQSEYVDKIGLIDVPKNRRMQKDAIATPHEVQSLRALCGSLQFASVHSRPDIATKVAYLQKSIPNAKVSDLLEANKVLKESKEHAKTSLFVRPLPFRSLTFASFGDASFASESNLKAQQGLFVMACANKLAQNECSDFSPISWSTKQIGRVVRSTLSAEAYAMSSSIDKLNWIRCMWGYILSPKFRWQHPEISLHELPKALLITDCKSLYDLMTKMATPNCQEWRTTIEVMLIREQAKDNAECRWISTAIMLADCLTKPMEASFLRQVLSLGRFRIYDEQQLLRENANRKFGNHWLNMEAQPPTKDSKMPP